MGDSVKMLIFQGDLGLLRTHETAAVRRVKFLMLL